MKIAGIPMNDIWAHRVLRDRGVETTRTENNRAEIVVYVESIELGHHSAAMNYRPYLHLNGELRSVRPHQQLPYSVDEVAYPAGGGETVDIYYEFDEEQLTELTQKGYFSPGFTLPEQVTGIEWELPATIDALVLAPAGNPEAGNADAPDVPVVFVQVHDLGSLDIDLESSGYDLTEYFADRSASTAQPPEQRDTAAGGMRTSSDTIRPLFHESDFDPTQATVTRQTPAEQRMPATKKMAQQLEEAAATLNSEEERLRRQREAQAGTSENLYRSRIAATLTDRAPATGGNEDPQPAPGRTLTDLSGDENDEPGIAPVHIAGPAEAKRLEALKQQVTQHAAGLDPGEPDPTTEQQL
ncbi:hypothetical protein F1D05_09555 [Kribbella qitaiheensis]|uniref:Uncharacterized protein n=1 Tax=Kribbella qitaiheensis TaxID=1544730 RepID=A0A7G6WVS2_9ACTN|nr:hypothetical protein [Kribbella qitaiheensis]QNE18087.1 hypothetical protein F1D05_09555 [Kribbella qitaiheensis]